ncbi:DUF4236 domain-containing protein [Curtobacterium sp. MCBD17_040]|uniref:DUF4236 domain-containing protein n=1 Tax=Curtobacterium sp. MCBD17_040 TaxID=2175674 RepID=UPI000DA89CEB|nr:DUF4236 domain-containing protein [Curtobacterium sp. MCBD17_040]WIB65418.1 DUF4236 domain-containing protein [Curtobacterium sp. MCBD17_040]
MGLIYRKTIRAGKNTRVNMSKSGVSVTKKLGPVTINSRGHISIRLAPGLSFRIF